MSPLSRAPSILLVVAGLSAFAPSRALSQPASAQVEAAATAPPAGWSGSSNAFSAWYADNGDTRPDDDRYGITLLRHNLLLDAGSARAAVRVDQDLFIQTGSIDPGGEGPHRVDRRSGSRLERISLEAEHSGAWVAFSATAGDFYAQLGRGLVLSLRKYDELGVDVSARGARVQAALWGERVVLTALGGLSNVVNVDPDIHSYLPDPLDRITGARVEGRLADWLSLSAQGAGFHSGTTLPGLLEQDRTYNYGGGLDVTLGSWTGGIEAARQLVRDTDTLDRGFGLYGTATGPIGPVVVLAEGKHYRNFHPVRSYQPSSRALIQYNLAPSAELIDQEVLDNTDTSGGRLQLDWSPAEGSGTVLQANYGLFRNRALAQDFSHLFGGLRLRSAAGTGFFGFAGMRREVDLGSRALTRRILQGELDLLMPLTLALSMQARLVGEHLAKLGSHSTRGNSVLEINWRNQLAVSGGYEWDTTTPKARTHYGYGALTYRPRDRFIAQTLIGTQRGGMKCFAGVCRLFPPFVGARLDLTVRY